MDRRFLDASPVLYAVLKPKKKLPKKIVELKIQASQILKRINEGELVVTSVIHLSEIANILETRKTFEEVSQFMIDLYMKNSILILGVTAEEYRNASILANKYRVGVNDTLAKIIMEKNGITEIYSFDKHFDSLNVIRVIN